MKRRVKWVNAEQCIVFKDEKQCCGGNPTLKKFTHKECRDATNSSNSRTQQQQLKQRTLCNQSGYPKTATATHPEFRTAEEEIAFYQALSKKRLDARVAKVLADAEAANHIPTPDTLKELQRVSEGGGPKLPPDPTTFTDVNSAPPPPSMAPRVAERVKKAREMQLTKRQKRDREKSKRILKAAGMKLNASGVPVPKTIEELLKERTNR